MSASWPGELGYEARFFEPIVCLDWVFVRIAGCTHRQGVTAMQGSITEFLKPRVVKVQPVAPRQARVVIEPF